MGKEKLFLVLEALPLEKELDAYDAEMIVRYKSSSNKAIPLYTMDLKWKNANKKLHMFTMPCIVFMDPNDETATDSMIRLSMATIRDQLRAGGSSIGAKENKDTVANPEIVPIWGRSDRSLFMAECATFEVINKGKTGFVT